MESSRTFVPQETGDFQYGFISVRICSKIFPSKWGFYAKSSVEKVSRLAAIVIRRSVAELAAARHQQANGQKKTETKLRWFLDRITNKCWLQNLLGYLNLM